MTAVVTLGNAAFRDYVTDGVPSSGAHQPVKSDVRALFAVLRTKLTANLTIYVRTDGNDANDGESDSSGGAKLTWQAAVNKAQSYDLNYNNIYIKAGEEGSAKTWNLGSSPITIYALTGFGSLYLQPSSSGTNITGTGGIFFLGSTGQTVWLGGLHLSGTGGYGLVSVNGNSVVQLDPAGGPNFGSHDSAHVWIHDNLAQALFLNSSYTISGGAPYHIIANNGGALALENNTVTISTAVAITTFVQASNNGTIQSTLTTFTNSGNVTGTKFSAVSGGVINTLGNGASYFPGTVAGLVLGGIYSDTWYTAFQYMPAGFYSAGDSSINKASPQFSLSKAASGQAASFFGKTAGVARWEAQYGTADAESTGNAGSNWALFAYADDGSFIASALGLNRATLAATFGGQVNAPAGTTARPSLNVPHGSAPTSPTNGDMWTTTAGLYVRINGSTVGPLS